MAFMSSNQRCKSIQSTGSYETKSHIEFFPTAEWREAAPFMYTRQQNLRDKFSDRVLDW